MARPSVLRFFVLLLGLGAAGCASRYEPSTADAIPEEVRATIRAAVDQQHRNGVLVGLVNERGVHVFSYPSTPNSTLYAVGSLTKVFTALCLADMVDRGELDLESPVNRYLPEEMHIPPRDGAELTLLHLATHTSGLPKEASAWDWTDPDSPDQIVRFAQSYSYPAAYGSRYVYSNLGMALLGRVMERHTGQPLASLIAERVTVPLGLADTTYELDPGQRRRLATPHLGSEAIAPERLRAPAAARAAGGLFSTADDLLRFLEANLAPETTQLAAVLNMAQKPVGETDEPDVDMGLGWKIYEKDAFRVIHHGGQSAGHQVFLGFDPGRDVGVVLLTDSRADDELDRIALYLLTGDAPLPDFSHPREILLEPDALATYAGTYRFDDGSLVVIAVQGGRLRYTESTAAGRMIRETEIYASSETDFHFADLPVTIVFDRPAAGAGTAPGLTLHVSDDETFRALRVP